MAEGWRKKLLNFIGHHLLAFPLPKGFFSGDNIFILLIKFCMMHINRFRDVNVFKGEN